MKYNKLIFVYCCRLYPMDCLGEQPQANTVDGDLSQTKSESQ